jgi:hypothetical protein
MARRLSEEIVTKSIISWIVLRGWKIITFDYPKSGTGIMIHPNTGVKMSKNKNAIIPDIIAVKENIAIYFENKDRFYKSDFEKLYTIKSTQNYSESIKQLLYGYNIEKMYYGIGIPNIQSELDKSAFLLSKIDFLVTVNPKLSVSVFYDLQDCLE